MRISAVDPIDCRQDHDEEILAAHLHENPLVTAADPARVMKFSDFLTLRELTGSSCMTPSTARAASSIRSR